MSDVIEMAEGRRVLEQIRTENEAKNRVRGRPPHEYLGEWLSTTVNKDECGRLNRKLRRVWRTHLDLEASDLMVLETIMDQSPGYNPTISQLAKLSGLAKRTVERSIARLMKKRAGGVVLVTAGPPHKVPGSAWVCNTYQLSNLGQALDKIEEVPHGDK